MSAANNPFVELSNAMADAVERAAASVVTVKARRRLPATGLVWSEDGYIVTANHVVERDEDIAVALPDGNEVSAELVGRDPSTDLALLKADASGLTPVAKAGDEARPGHIVLALGRAYGGSPAAALGAVSLVGGPLRTRHGGSIERPVRTDLTMYPGFSGGPLVNAAGEVIGLNTSALSRGLPVTVPHAVINRVVGTLREKGRIARGYLGVALQPVRIPASVREQTGSDQEAGLLIIGVEEDSPAAQAGLMLGDTIVTFGGQPVDDPRFLHELLGPDSVGAAQAVRALRAGQIVEVEVTVGER